MDNCIPKNLQKYYYLAAYAKKNSFLLTSALVSHLSHNVLTAFRTMPTALVSHPSHTCTCSIQNNAHSISLSLFTYMYIQCSELCPEHCIHSSCACPDPRKFTKCLFWWRTPVASPWNRLQCSDTVHTAQTKAATLSSIYCVSHQWVQYTAGISLAR